MRSARPGLIAAALLALALTSARRADADVSTFRVLGGISLDTGANGVFARGDLRVGPRLTATVRANLVLRGGGGPYPDSWPLTAEAGLTLGKPPPPPGTLGMRFHSGWRAGAYYQDRVEALGESLFKTFVPSTTIGAYAGWGFGLPGPKVRFALAFDLMLGAVVARGEPRDELGAPVVDPEPDPGHVGGRLDFTTGIGPEPYGLGLDIQMGYRPGLATAWFVTVGLGIYLGA